MKDSLHVPSLVVILLLGAATGVAQPPLPPPGCGTAAAAGWLDFWVGEWTVTIGPQQVGRSRIERVVDGCAIIEHWEDARGGTGKSLFHLTPDGRSWRQLWVTNRAMLPGGVKDKRLIARYPDGGVRFQGEIATPDGVMLDRTTLTPQPGGTVRQLIETSRDGGATWSAGFDAIYRPRTSG